ncbi:MAG: hypothetical protein ACK5PF_02330 [bacterium]
MSKGLIAFVGLIYAFIATTQYLKGNTGMAICFAGYAFSNIGLMMVAT